MLYREASSPTLALMNPPTSKHTHRLFSTKRTEHFVTKKHVTEFWNEFQKPQNKYKHTQQQSFEFDSSPTDFHSRM